MYVFCAAAAAEGRELQRRQTIRRDFFFLHLRCRIYLFSAQHSRSLRRRDARDIISAIRFSLLLLLPLLLLFVVDTARSLRKTSLRRENHLHVAKHIGCPPIIFFFLILFFFVVVAVFCFFSSFILVFMKGKERSAANSILVCRRSTTNNL